MCKDRFMCTVERMRWVRFVRLSVGKEKVFVFRPQCGVSRRRHSVATEQTHFVCNVTCLMSIDVKLNAFICLQFAIFPYFNGVEVEATLC